MKGLSKYWILGALLLVAYVFVEYNRPKPINWAPTYLPEDKIPYGTYILKHQIYDIFPGSTVRSVNGDLAENLKLNSTGSTNYLIIASKFSPDKASIKSMVDFVKKGNHFLIASTQFGEDFEEQFKVKVSGSDWLDRKRKYSINFENPKLKFEYDYYFDNAIANQYFSSFDTLRAEVLGTRQALLANFITYKFGKGRIFIMPNPQLFTNFALLQEPGMDYAAKALSYLPTHQNLVWDESFVKPEGIDRSPLRVIFKYEELKWAYLLTLFSLLLFLLYDMKRRQRIIPIIEPLQNTTAQFVQTVGRVYYQKRNHADMVAKKSAFLLDYVRNKYRVKAISFDEETKQILIAKTGATEEVISELFDVITKLKSLDKITDGQLISLNKILEKFYKQDQ